MLVRSSPGKVMTAESAAGLVLEFFFFFFLIRYVRNFIRKNEPTTLKCTRVAQIKSLDYNNQ